MKSKRHDCWNFGYSMSKILGVRLESGKVIPVWELERFEPDRIVTVKELKETEWSKDMEDLQRSLLIAGAFRYGRLNAPGKKQFDRISDSIRRLQLYQKTHNILHLGDSNNLNMLEFEEGRHPDRHFQNEDDTTHTEEL